MNNAHLVLLISWTLVGHFSIISFGRKIIQATTKNLKSHLGAKRATDSFQWAEPKEPVLCKEPEFPSSSWNTFRSDWRLCTCVYLHSGWLCTCVYLHSGCRVLLCCIHFISNRASCADLHLQLQLDSSVTLRSHLPSAVCRSGALCESPHDCGCWRENQMKKVWADRHPFPFNPNSSAPWEPVLDSRLFISLNTVEISAFSVSRAGSANTWLAAKMTCCLLGEFHL